MSDSNKSKRHIFVYQQALAGFALLAGIVLVYICTFIPPKGEVSTSILTFFGAICTYSGALLGVTSTIEKGMFKISAEQQRYKDELRKELNNNNHETTK